MKRFGLLSILFLLPLAGGKKKETTQVLELPKDPPAAVAAETRNLIFQVAPLSSKGLLSQQTRDGVKALIKMSNGSTIVKIRAFVAGAGDLRRVPAIVSESLTEKKLPLPVVTVVQVGGLPLEGAQVALESISVGRKEVNPRGIAFVSGQMESSEDPLSPIGPLAEKSLAGLDKALKGISDSVLQLTCFTSSLEGVGRVQSILASRYPSAAVNVVMMQRASPRGTVDCQATARLTSQGTGNPQASAVNTTKIVFSGIQMAFGFEDKDARLAFQRLNKALEPLGASLNSAAMINFYPLSGSIANQVRRVSAEFLDAKRTPASTMELFEGLPAMAASFAIDVAALPGQP